MYGTKRKIIDGTLKKYFWSNLGPHAQKQTLIVKIEAKTPNVEKTLSIQPF